LARLGGYFDFLLVGLVSMRLNGVVSSKFQGITME
jgi:hypothetical protein